MTFIDTIDAVIVGAFLASYVKYPPIGRDGDPHCVDCGATTLEVDDEIDMVCYHVFRCRECQQARLDRAAVDLSLTPNYLDGTHPPGAATPITIKDWQRALYSTPLSIQDVMADGWDPIAPPSEANHPPCQACELGTVGALCTCGDWESTGEPAPPPGTA